MQITLGGIAYPVDCIMGSGFISPNTEYQKNFTCHFFAIPPQRMILTHWPPRTKQQLLKDALTLSKFRPLIPLSPKAAEYGINPDIWSECLEVPVETCNPVVSVNFTCNTDVKLIAKLSNIQREIDDSTSAHEVAYQKLVYINRKVSPTKQENSIANVRAAVPFIGRYTLNIFASGNNSTSNYEIVLSYQLQCSTNIGSQYQIGYPIMYDMAAAAFDFRLLHWNKPMPDYRCEILSGKLDIAFHAKPDLQFFHYIVEGTAENPAKASNTHHHNTLIAQNEYGDPHLHALRTVFPSEGWWTVYLCATKAALKSDTQQPTVSGYTTIFKYSVHIKKSESKQSFPHISVPYIRLTYPEAISASGREILSVPFYSLSALEFCCYLTHETQTSELMENYATVTVNSSDSLPKETHGKQHYNLHVIFPKPGKWFVHVYGRDSTATATEKDIGLFTLNVDVEGALRGKLFPTINSSIATELNISFYESGCITFCDAGSPFTYKFKAPRKSIHLIPNIALNGGNGDTVDKESLQQCILLSPSAAEDSELSMYTLNAVFPSAGTWSVQLFGACAESSSDFDSYKLVMHIQLQVTEPTPVMCYPTIYPAFYDLGLRIPNELLLYSQVSEGSEVKFPFHSPEAMVFDTRLTQGNETFINQAIVHYGKGATGNEIQQCILHIVFPKTGQWVIHLYAGSSKGVQNDSCQPEELNTEKKAVFALKIKALSCNHTHTFPQIFDPFHSKFSLKLDEEKYPLTSRIKSIPSIVTIPFYSPPSVKFWHHATTPDSETPDSNPITRMYSDPQTGLHELSVEIAEHGQVVVILSAQMSNSSDDQKQKWITVLKHTIQAL